MYDFMRGKGILYKVERFLSYSGKLSSPPIIRISSLVDRFTQGKFFRAKPRYQLYSGSSSFYKPLYQILQLLTILRTAVNLTVTAISGAMVSHDLPDHGNSTITVVSNTTVHCGLINNMLWNS